MNVHDGKQGIYFLGNDRVMNWVIALLESLRAHEPEIPLVLIPYDQNLDKISRLAGRYRFSILEDPALLQLDELGRSFADSEEEQKWVHNFRKLAAFWGPFERGMFLDADIIILDRLQGLFDAFAGSSLDFCFFDESNEYVYNSKAFVETVRKDWGGRLFNTGYWAVRRGALDFARVAALAREAAAIKKEFFFAIDQPFLNYCVHRSGLKHGGFSDLMPDLSHHHWASRKRCIRRDSDGTYRIRCSGSPDYGKKVKLLHWAGYKPEPLMPYRDEFLRYRLRPLDGYDRMSYQTQEWVSYLLGGGLWRNVRGGVARWRKIHLQTA